jgi:hypothetical protein
MTATATTLRQSTRLHDGNAVGSYARTASSSPPTV